MIKSTLPLDDGAPNQPPTADRPEAPPGFELLEEVGRGGMGVVYSARDLALDREVALKFLQERYDHGSRAAARFVEEAHITGQLQHPGVPAIHQIGLLADGRPYLVMKLIKGSTLDEILKQGAAIDPLSVFEAVAQTVGYAHAHGVIHRDLKPANVMVGGFGEVQLMDWGLAKVLRGSAAEPEAAAAAAAETTTMRTRIHTPRDPDGDRTRAGSVLGTPAYMAPEQAAGEIDKIDARSDVFGLGAILCALLTGKPPFGGADSESVRLAAVRGQTEEVFARLDASSADPDVIALCKRCLAFEPADRPPSGDAVAAEAASLRAAADDRARQAERDRAAAEARAQEQAKRRRAIQRAAGGVVAALLLGVVGTGIGLHRANAARRAAEAARAAEAQQRELAEKNEAAAKAVVGFFENHVFAAARPKGQDGGLGFDVSLRNAILASLPILDKAFTNQPLVEARLRLTLGTTFKHLGSPDRAVEQYERARSLCARYNGPDHPETLTVMNNLALGYTDMGRHEEALKLNEKTLATRRRVLGPDHPDTLASAHNLAINHVELGRFEQALKLDEETRAARKRVLSSDHPNTLRSMNNLARDHLALGRFGEALKLFEETLAARRRVLGPDHPDTLLSMNDLARGYRYMGRREEALKLNEETLAAKRRVLGPDHPGTLTSMNNLALSYTDMGRHEEALKLNEETLATLNRVLAPDHPDTLKCMNNLALSYANMGRHEEALKLNEKTLATRRRVLGPDHPDTLGSASNLAHDYLVLGRFGEALKLSEETLATQKRVLGADHPDTLESMHALAHGCDGMGRHEEALKLFEEMLATRRRVLGADHPWTLKSMWETAKALGESNRGDEAILLIDEFLAKAAGKAVDPRLIQTVILLRLRHFQKADDPAGCRTTAAMWEKLNGGDAGSLYNAACFRAVAAAVQTKAGGSDAERLAREDADRAMDWLKKAVAAGFADKAHMEQDDDLAALRDRDDFKTLMTGLK